MQLTVENYNKGMLVDEELMGGVSPDPQNPGQFTAFVLRHSTGEYLGFQAFTQLEDALKAINSVERNWAYEKTGGCGEEMCDGGNCPAGGCANKGSEICPKG